MSHLSLQPGRAYSFNYPRYNYRLLPTINEARRIIVGSVRDTLFEPLDRSTESLNPMLNRGRWLITGRDLDKDVERSFYGESMRDIRSLTDDDLEPLKDVEYVVIEQFRVAFKSTRLQDALTYRFKRKSGAVCAVLRLVSREIEEVVSAVDSPDDADA